jgi:hypothetical protein
LGYLCGVSQSFLSFLAVSCERITGEVEDELLTRYGYTEVKATGSANLHIAIEVNLSSFSYSERI